MFSQVSHFVWFRLYILSDITYSLLQIPPTVFTYVGDLDRTSRSIIAGFMQNRCTQPSMKATQWLLDPLNQTQWIKSTIYQALPPLTYGERWEVIVKGPIPSPSNAHLPLGHPHALPRLKSRKSTPSPTLVNSEETADNARTTI